MQRLLNGGGEAPLAALLADALSGRGGEFQLDSADTVGEAIERLGSEAFDRRPADLPLPGGDGINVERLAKAPHRRLTPAATTSPAHGQERERLRRQGAATIHERPFDLDAPGRRLLALGATEDWN